MAALIREQSRPIIRPWPAQELSKAAPPKTKGWPKAKMPTVPTPKGTFGDAAHAYVHAEKASSSSSGYVSGLAHTLERAQTDASEARPKASAAVPKASTAVPKASAAVPKASAAVPKASTAVPKASAVAIRESPGSDDSGSEEENIDEIPALVGIEPDTIVPKCWKHRDHEDEPTLAGVGQILSKAHRLECTDQPAVNIVASQQQPAVLVDSGANETIRPWDETINEAGCKRTSVVTASGDRVSALRTKDGELCIKSSGESRDWLLSVRRLVEAGGTFQWTQNGAEVTFRDHEGSEQHIKCHIINGLPFLDWTEFKPIRILLSKHHKSQGGTVHKAAAADPQWRSCETCAMEELYQTMWREETYQATAVESQALLSSETEAKEMLNKDSISFPEVWDLVQRAGLKGQRTRRDRLLESQEQGGRVQIWVFGMYCHGGITGLTSLTRERPFLTRLLVRLMRQELPDLSFTTVTLAIDSTLKPHRDLANAVNSRAGIVGISEFHGGRLWVEHPDGSIKRRISADKVKVGKLLDVCQQAQIFDP